MATVSIDRALAEKIRAARLAERWGKEEAARRANVSSITWTRVEEMQSVQEMSIAKILGALGLDASGDPIPSPEWVSAPGPRVEGASEDAVLAAIRAMRADLEEMNRRLERIEGQGEHP